MPKMSAEDREMMVMDFVLEECDAVMNCASARDACDNEVDFFINLVHELAFEMADHARFGS